MVKEVNDKGEYDEIKKGGKVMVDYWATWCGPCRMIAPKIEEFEKQYPNIVFIKVDVDKAQEISEEEGISAMPTFKFFNAGAKACDDVVGASEAKIKEGLEKLNAM